MADNANPKYKTIVGLEIHVELNTKSKMFCQCPADYFGKDPNTHVCPVCLAMPGGLPVPNKEAIRRTILLGQALNCHINNEFKFDRKHYTYPDLPKGYQISQYDQPIAEHGTVPIKTESGVKEFRIKRVHLEEDTGKLTHEGEESLIDFNRGGVPLVEIVTEPDFDNGEDVKAFLEELQVIVRYLGIANADMEKGDMRLEPNISVQLAEKYPELPPYKVEVKNINSFRFVKKAIEFETARHIEILEEGSTPQQETRGYDSATGTTVTQRVKEEAADYRYFPDPDIPTFVYTDEQLDEIRAEMPEMPFAKVERYINEFGVRESDAQIITRDRGQAEKFEAVVTEYAKKVGISENEAGALVAKLMVNKKVDWEEEVGVIVEVIAKQSKPVETDSGKLAEVVDAVIAANEKAVQDYKSGSNPNSIMFLVGQVMREMKGQADAATVKEALLNKLD
ncbi:MAG: Asp-tRNA(Asn)/Glu-tRNA(Gln) amidotransferase subunit GatB [Candidatus Dojkabacteria bacterium]|nr:MAG: Asp-tRNA(Asn)/Glu-tRNA(Gln) amidotransferase subunit GatB [Candidatus Dojkabacteria bacterium]